MLKKIAICDFDDTLSPADSMFINARLEAAAYLKHVVERETGVELSQNKVFEKIVETDKRNHKIYGRRTKRILLTIMDAAEKIAEDNGFKIAKDDYMELACIALKVFDPDEIAKLSMMWGAKKLLDFLKENEFEIKILSVGEYPIQKLKMDSVHLKRWVGEDDIVIVKPKSPNSSKRPEYKRILQERLENGDKVLALAIGNAWDSDIKTVLEARDELPEELNKNLRLVAIYREHEYKIDPSKNRIELDEEEENASHGDGIIELQPDVFEVKPLTNAIQVIERVLQQV